MFPVIFEPTITMGLVVQTVLLGITFTIFLQGMKNQLSLIKSDIQYLQESQRSLAEAFSQLGKILTQVAVQDNRINMIDKRMDELSHGEGFVRKNK
jgi:hypothetical protein